MAAVVFYLKRGGGIRVGMPAAEAAHIAEVLTEAMSDPGRQDATFTISPDAGGTYELTVGSLAAVVAE